MRTNKYHTPRLHNGVTGNSGILLNMIAYKGQITNKGRRGVGGLKIFGARFFFFESYSSTGSFFSFSQIFLKAQPLAGIFLGKVTQPPVICNGPSLKLAFTQGQTITYT